MTRFHLNYLHSLNVCNENVFPNKEIISREEICLYFLSLRELRKLRAVYLWRDSNLITSILLMFKLNKESLVK